MGKANSRRSMRLMIVSIHPDRLAKQSYSDKWTYFLKKHGVRINYVNLYRNNVLEQVQHSDGVMWRWNLEFPDRILAPRILDIIEHELGIPVYPEYKMRYAWDDKIKQYYLFEMHRIDTPKTRIFWNYKNALEWIEKTDFPKVFKLATGASSRNVRLIKNKNEARMIVKKMFSTGIYTGQNLTKFTTADIPKKYFHIAKGVYQNFRDKLFFSERCKKQIKSNLLEKHYVFFQEFIEGNTFDTRVTVIGNRAFAFRRFNRLDDFRASGSGKIDYNPKEINMKCISKAFEISRKLGLECMAYDFLLKNNVPLVTEMCWTFLDEAVYNCLGHWNPDLEWKEGHMWPEEAQVEGFIDRINRAGLKGNPK